MNMNGQQQNATHSIIANRERHENTLLLQVILFILFLRLLCFFVTHQLGVAILTIHAHAHSLPKHPDSSRSPHTRAPLQSPFHAPNSNTECQSTHHPSRGSRQSLEFVAICSLWTHSSPPRAVKNLSETTGWIFGNGSCEEPASPCRTLQSCSECVAACLPSTPLWTNCPACG